MTKRTPLSGGLFLFLAPTLGAIYGVRQGEPSWWILVGAGVGIVLALTVWLVDRRRR